MSLLPDSRGEKKYNKNEQKQEVFRAVARTPKKPNKMKCDSIMIAWDY